ncbi:MAG: hypothetical protein ACPL4I_10890 [Bacteroidota bacterium]
MTVKFNVLGAELDLSALLSLVERCHETEYGSYECIAFMRTPDMVHVQNFDDAAYVNLYYHCTRVVADVVREGDQLKVKKVAVYSLCELSC